MRILLFLCASALFAEDIWKTKPYREWSEKEIKRILTNSPWAKEVNASMPGVGGGGGGGMTKGGGRRGGGGGGGGMGSMDASQGMGGGGGMGEAGGGGGGMGGGGGAPTVTAKVRWQTAMPIRQAVVKMRFGAEASTSQQAAQILGNRDPIYIVAVEGIPVAMLRGGGQQNVDRMRAMLTKTSQIKRGKKDPILPVQVDIGMADKALIVYLVFPKKEGDEIVLDDKEVEFVTKFGPMEFKRKFKLADMVVDGQLSL